MAAAARKSILVTGGNAGIGLALCTQLAVEHDAQVYMGTRNAERGAVGLKTITGTNDKNYAGVELAPPLSHMPASN